MKALAAFLRVGSVALAASVLTGCIASSPSRSQLPGAPPASSTATPTASARASIAASSAATMSMSLETGRGGHTATLLHDGRVLVVGGYPGVANMSAEVWDPTTNSAAMAGSLAAGRHYHTATLLDDGRVLVVGGVHSDEFVGAAEVWDPATETFRPAGSLATARALHAATRLVDGRVLIVGGIVSRTTGKVIGEAELWDPSTNTFRPAGTLAWPRAWATATTLADGRVLIAGGPAAAEAWDPTTMTFGPAGELQEPRWWGTATRLRDGTVLMVGGLAGEGFGSGNDGRATTDRWDPEANSFTSAGALVEARGLHTATLLPDGRVLVAGGAIEPGKLPASTEIWDPATDLFSAGPPLAVPRSAHTATILPDRRVVVTGGDDGTTEGLASVEYVVPER